MGRCTTRSIASECNYFVGEIIRLLDFLERRDFGKYYWAYEICSFHRDTSINSVGRLEDGHGYELM